jgi:hypothetical protein
MLKEIARKPAFTVLDLAKMFTVSTRAIQSWISNGTLNKLIVPGKAKVPPVDIETLPTGSNEVRSEDTLPRTIQGPSQPVRHYLDLDRIAAIPEKLRKLRVKAVGMQVDNPAHLVTAELMLRFLIILAWRPRTIRECRVGGTTPNLFKGTIPASVRVGLPDWVLQEQEANPNAEFWQIKFHPNETKNNIDVHMILPQRLIGPLEEYMDHFRPQLVGECDPGTLFVNRRGEAFKPNDVTTLLSKLTAVHGGVRVTPRLIRETVAFAWMADHPTDFLTLSKILWLKHDDKVIRFAPRGFNLSSGVCGMEKWLDSREADRNDGSKTLEPYRDCPGQTRRD